MMMSLHGSQSPRCILAFDLDREISPRPSPHPNSRDLRHTGARFLFITKAIPRVCGPTVVNSETTNATTWANTDRQRVD